MGLLKNHFVLVLIIVGVVLYFPSLFGGFLWDDEDFVYANTYVAGFEVDKFFTDDVVAGRGKESNYFRPIQLLVYATVHQVFGFNPFWFHLAGVLFHTGAAVAVFYFFYFLIKEERAAFLTALIFLIHPVQTEAVSYVSGLSDSLFVLFGMMALILLLFRSAKRKYWFLSLGFFGLALLAKETGLVFLIFVFLLVIFSGEKLPKRVLGVVWPYFFLAGIYFVYHETVIAGLEMKFLWGEGEYASSVWVRLATFVGNGPMRLGLLLFPTELFMERDASIKIFQSLLSLPVVFWALIVAGTGIIVERISRGWRRRKAVVFCFLAYWASLSVYSGVVLINGIFYEHFLYLAMVFFFGFLVLVGKEIVGERGRVILVGGVIIWLVYLAVRNIFRQGEWADSVRFYQQTLNHAPGSIRVINGLGMALSDRGRLAEAEKVFVGAIEKNPMVPNLYHNLANVYLASGKVELAEKNFLKAIEVAPAFYYSYDLLRQLYVSQGREREALELGRKREGGL